MKQRDYRIICDCQRHARREKSLLRRGARVVSRAVAVLVTLPLAFAAFDVPTSAMNFDLRAVKTPLLKKERARQLPIFTTPAVREQFLTGEPLAAPTLEVFKEQYFRRNVPYGAIIVREARRNNLPPELVAAMVHTESDFRPTLVSNKSAQGLMQIVPSTARILGIRNPFDPEENIAAGTKYYRYLLDRFDNQTMALAAYNAGPGNVSRFGGVPPFGETRSYIAKVNRRTHRYRQRVHNNYLATLRVTRASATATAH
ncbi:MAG TPA: lytic transglycosylase domain-containing protein [Thermoanaerobaculia bacterium]|jgi:soluble lytic murein transglycosylase-like protein